MSEPRKFKNQVRVTLTQGLKYSYAGFIFTKDVPLEVSPKVAQHLYDKADKLRIVHTVVRGSVAEKSCAWEHKFLFEELESPVATPAVALKEGSTEEKTPKEEKPEGRGARSKKE